MSQGLRRSFTFSDIGGEKIKALPLSQYGGRVYEIRSASSSDATVYYAFPNQRTGNWELYLKPESSPESSTESEPESIPLETEQMFESPTSAPDDANVATDTLHQRAEGLFKNQTMLFSVPSALREGVSVGEKKQDGFVFDVLQYDIIEMSVTLPGADTHRMPIGLGGFGQSMKMRVPKEHQQDHIYKVYAMLCYMARTCSMLALDVFVLLVFGASVPFLLYKGSAWDLKRVWDRFFNLESQFSRYERKFKSDDKDVREKAVEDWKNAWVNEFYEKYNNITISRGARNYRSTEGSIPTRLRVRYDTPSDFLYSLRSLLRFDTNCLTPQKVFEERRQIFKKYAIKLGMERNQVVHYQWEKSMRMYDEFVFSFVFREKKNNNNQIKSNKKRFSMTQRNHASSARKRGAWVS
jgi:hypothetical protein